MSGDITGLCRDHSFESATAMCRRCSLEFCDTCVVYPFGPKKPYCKECAMAAGGVRTHVSRPAQPPRLVRKRVKAFEAFKTAQDTAAPSTAPILIDPVLQESPQETDPIAAPVPAMTGSAAADLLEHIPDAPLLPPPPPGAEDSTDGLAPPIDWNQPFG